MFKIFKQQAPTYKTEQIIEGEKVEIDYTDFRDIRNNSKYEEFEVGSIAVKDNRIVVTDPLLCYNPYPLEKRVPNGNYNVYLYFVKTPMGYRTAYAMINFIDSVPALWEYALVDREYLNAEEKKLNGLFPVDAGLLSLSSGLAYARYSEMYDLYLEQNPDGNFYDDVLAVEFKKNGNNPEGSFDGGDWINYSLEATQENIIMFSSGLGDGLYPAYWGLGKEGEPYKLIIDFLTLERLGKIEKTKS